MPNPLPPPFILDYFIVDDEEKIVPKTINIDKPTLTEAWQEASDWLDCERKFNPVIFQSFVCDDINWGVRWSDPNFLEPHILPTTL